MGDLGVIFIGAPLGLAIIIGFAVLHEKVFNVDPTGLRPSSLLSKVVFAIGLPAAVALAWYCASIIQ